MKFFKNREYGGRGKRGAKFSKKLASVYMVYEWPLRDHIHHNIGIHTPLDLLEVVMDLEVPATLSPKNGLNKILKKFNSYTMGGGELTESAA